MEAFGEKRTVIHLVLNNASVLSPALVWLLLIQIIDLFRRLFIPPIIYRERANYVMNTMY